MSETLSSVGHKLVLGIVAVPDGSLLLFSSCDIDLGPKLHPPGV